MKEIQNLIAWVSSFNGPEVDCESLVEWLEMENRAALRRGSQIASRVLVGLAGFAVGGFVAAMIGVEIEQSTGRGPSAPGVFVAILLAALLGSVGFVRLCFGPRRKFLIQSNRDADAARAIAHLRSVHGYKGLRGELGEHGVMELNEGAQIFLRCRSILTSAPWTSESPADPWIEVRDDLLKAMESALERLTLYVVRKRPFSDIGPVLDEMRRASSEIQRITEQRSSASGGAARDLRASLARMKELAAAEDELLRVRD